MFSQAIEVKDVIETTTFFWKSGVKGSCTVEEFRGSLEKTDGKLLIYKKYNSRDSAADDPFPISQSTPRKVL